MMTAEEWSDKPTGSNDGRRFDVSFPDLLRAYEAAQEADIATVDAMWMILTMDCPRAERDAARAELARVTEALRFGVELIEGDSFGSDWKKGCADFRRMARAALPTQEPKP